MTYLVEVTQEDIDKGFKQTCGACPVAFAIKRVTGCKLITVTGERACIDHASVLLPRECFGLIYSFDYGQPVSPFSFQIEVPD